LVVRSKEEKAANYPYNFELIYVGFFKVIEEFPPERIEQMVRVNAPALLYSAAREMLVYLTGRGRMPGILLPSITFIEPIKPAPKRVGKRSSPRVKIAARKK